MSTKCEIFLKFNDSKELILLNDRQVISKLPVVIRALEGLNPNWESEDIVYPEPLEMSNFTIAVGKFLIGNVLKFKTPQETFGEAERDATKQDLQFLRDVLKFVDFLECGSFSETIACAIAKKLTELPQAEMFRLFGVEHEDAKGPSQSK